MKKKVLVVDDEKEIVEFLEKFLNRFDVTVLKATRGNEAIEIYNFHKPDLIFLDIQMPDKDGLTVLKELKELNPLIKVIMITGKEDRDFMEKAKVYGAIDYITKPLDLGDLFVKIKKFILK